MNETDITINSLLNNYKFWDKKREGYLSCVGKIKEWQGEILEWNKVNLKQQKIIAKRLAKIKLVFSRKRQLNIN